MGAIGYTGERLKPLPAHALALRHGLHFEPVSKFGTTDDLSRRVQQVAGSRFSHVRKAMRCALRWDLKHGFKQEGEGLDLSVAYAVGDKEPSEANEVESYLKAVIWREGQAFDTVHKKSDWTTLTPIELIVWMNECIGEKSLPPDRLWTGRHIYSEVIWTKAPLDTIFEDVPAPRGLRGRDTREV